MNKTCEHCHYASKNMFLLDEIFCFCPDNGKETPKIYDSIDKVFITGVAYLQVVELDTCKHWEAASDER